MIIRFDSLALGKPIVNSSRKTRFGLKKVCSAVFDWINTSNYIPNFDAILFCSVVFLLGCMVIAYTFVAGRLSQYRPRQVSVPAAANVHIQAVWWQQAPRAWNLQPSAVWSPAVPGVANVKSNPALWQNVPAAFGKPRKDVDIGNVQSPLTGSYGQAEAHALAPAPTGCLRDSAWRAF
jgi:hypothetical protein